VPAISVAILYSGVALECVLAWRLVKQRLWCSYPWFALLVLWVLARTAALFAVQRLAPDSYASFYWGTDAVDVGLRFLVVGEVFRQTFPAAGALRAALFKGFVVAALLLTIFAVGTFWSLHVYTQSRSIHLAFERSFSFAQAMMTLGTLMVARYYGLRLGRNVWGIAIAFGAWISLNTANNAIVDLQYAFIPYWQILRPLSFVAMLAIWTWALWSYAPNPAIMPEFSRAPEAELARWAQSWSRTLTSIRRVIQP
jgi:hypothetical protein